MLPITERDVVIQVARCAADDLVVQTIALWNPTVKIPVLKWATPRLLARAALPWVPEVAWALSSPTIVKLRDKSPMGLAQSSLHD